LSNLSTKYLDNHDVAQYDARLERNKQELMGLYLNDLYSDKNMVGFLKNLANEVEEAGGGAEDFTGGAAMA